MVHAVCKDTVCTFVFMQVCDALFNFGDANTVDLGLRTKAYPCQATGGTSAQGGVALIRFFIAADRRLTLL